MRLFYTLPFALLLSCGWGDDPKSLEAAPGSNLSGGQSSFGSSTSLNLGGQAMPNPMPNDPTLNDPMPRESGYY